MTTSTTDPVRAAGKPTHCSTCPFRDYAHVPSTQDERARIDEHNSARILFVGDHPSLTSPHGVGGPFQDRAGVIVRMALGRLRQAYSQVTEADAWFKKLGIYHTYAVQCMTDDRVPKEVTAHCRHLLERTIASIRPKLVVAFGAEAMRSVLGRSKLRFDAVRGSALEHRIPHYDEPFQVFVTFSPKAVLAQTGLFNELMRDLSAAFLLTEGRVKRERHTAEFLRSQYRFPHTVAEVQQLCDEIINYANEGSDPNKHLIAVDTETTSLEPYDPTFRIICISFAWAELKAASIILDHPQAHWSSEELAQVKQHVQRVLASSKPKVLHNAQFDRQGLCHHYGWPLENIVWDTMGAEHLLEEDKQGSYDLKTMTRVRLPAYAGYEDKVAELREAHGGMTRAQANKAFRKATEQYRHQLTEYTALEEAYEKARAQFCTATERWQRKYAEEKTRAAAARKAGETDPKRRRIQQDLVDKKPKGPLKPHRPEEPQLQQPFDYTMIPLNDLELYAAVDADVTRQHLLHQHTRMDAEQKEDLKERVRLNMPAPPAPVRRLMSAHVLPTSATLAAMEYTGFPVDVKYLEELDAKLEVVARETEEKIYELAGQRFVLGNPQEVTRILFNEGFHEADGRRARIDAGSTKIARTPKGQIKADEKTLLYVANTYKYDFPKLIIRHRKACKARSPFLTNVREHAVIDGRMHPGFHLIGTSTGRTSSSGENMQNIPKKLADVNIKKIFIPPEGHILCNTDAKGAEVRLFAAYSNDAELIKSINDGLDTHSYFTAEIYPDRYTYEYIEQQRRLVDDLTDRRSKLAKEGLKLSPEDAVELSTAEAVVKQRTNTKRVVFGTLYGAQAAKIAETAGISKSEAQKVIDGLFRRYPSIPAYIQSTETEVRLFRCIYTYVGRKRRFPLADRQSFASRCFRQAVNFKIQSTSSDIVLWVLNQIYPVVTRDLHGFFHATVHDSLVFSVPPQYVSQIPEVMREYGTRRVAELFPWLPVQFLWDVEVGPSYGETVDIRKYFEEKKKQQILASTGDQHGPEDEIITEDEFRTNIQEAVAE
jgi:uracil-DNA glycosylase family 4